MTPKVFEFSFSFSNRFIKVIHILAWMTVAITNTISVAAAAGLTGSFSTLPAGANVSLTPEGTIDWAHWGLTTSDDFNHKAGVASLITNFAAIGDAEIQQFGDNATGYTWTDGEPEIQANNATAGIYVAGQDNGFKFSVPADTTARTLKVYVGAYNAGMKFQATLSDGSAPAYMETKFRNVEDGPNAVFTLNYAASSANQTLLVSFTVGEFLDFGNVTLQAATLGPAAPSIELVRPESDALFYAVADGLVIRASTLAPRSLATNRIRLFLNDKDMSAGLTFTGTPTAWDVTLGTLETNVFYRARITATDDLGRSSTNSFSFDTFVPASVVVIEAEDYNYGDGVCDAGTLNPASTIGGLYQQTPPSSGYGTNGVQVGGLQTNGTRLGYFGAAGLPGVDFNDASETPVGDPAYRPCDPVVTGTGNTYFADTAPDLRRARFVATGVRDFVVADWQAGDWLNYTRAFQGRYRCYIRAATQSDGQTIALNRVTSDPTQPNQSVETIGQFSLTRSGLLLGLRTVPLLDTNGAPVTVQLDGVQTLRLTAPDGASSISVNYLVFVPEVPHQATSPVLVNAIVSGGSITFSFQTESGFTYAVEYRELLGTAAWQRQAPTIAGDGAVKSFNRPISASTGFFRVVAE